MPVKNYVNIKLTLSLKIVDLHYLHRVSNLHCICNEIQTEVSVASLQIYLMK